MPAMQAYDLWWNAYRSFKMRSALKQCVMALWFSIAAMTCLTATDQPLLSQSLDEDQVIERLDPPEFGFYAKAINCDGIFIRGSKSVRDNSLVQTCHRVTQMLAMLDTVQRNMTQRGVELHIVSMGEDVASLPEYRNGNSSNLSGHPATQGGIYEVCLETPNEADGMIDQCTHQFALSIMLYGFDTAIRRHIEEGFRNARVARLWEGTVASSNPQEYWAQLSTWYFGGQGKSSDPRTSLPPSGPAGLKQYDPNGFTLLNRIYGGMERPKVIEVVRARSVSKLAISGTNNVPAELQLVNNSGRPIRVSWMDAAGNIRAMGELGPFNRTILDTSLSQVWTVKDQRGVEMDRFIVENSVSEYIAAD
jgi:hypothetical protein